MIHENDNKEHDTVPASWEHFEVQLDEQSNRNSERSPPLVNF